MALNIPMPDLPGNSFLKGVDTGSSMFSRMIQPVLERERLKQQQDQFVQNLALQKQAEGRAQTLLPLMVQQYQDAHNTAASEAAIKNIYRGLIQDALSGSNTGGASGAGGSPTGGAPTAPPMPQFAMPQQAGGQVPGMGGMTPNAGGQAPAIAGATPDAGGGAPQQQPMAPPPVNSVPVAPSPTGAPTQQPGQAGQGEHELRPGNPRLSKLDMVAGLVPGVPKPVQHISGGMVFTTYPSGRMTVQKVQDMQSPGAQTVSAKEASKIRDQATALANSANLVQQGYDLLDNNSDLTGIGSGLASKFNLSNNPELGKFTTVTGKLQAELGKYAASRGGIQAVNWAGSVKPSSWKPEDYNYGMFEGIQKNLQDDYNTLNAQYKAATGQDLPVPLPAMKTSRGPSGKEGKEANKGKVTKWKMTGGQLVKE